MSSPLLLVPRPQVHRTHHRPPPGAHHTLPTSIQLSLPPRGLNVAWIRHAAAGVCRPRWACELGQSISASVSDRDGEARVGGSVFAVRMRRLASGGKWRWLPGSGLGGADAASRRCKLRLGRRGCSSNFSGQGGADVVAGGVPPIPRRQQSTSSRCSKPSLDASSSYGVSDRSPLF